MSDFDEFDDFDSFAVDESFLQQVDDIAARATARPAPPAPAPRAPIQPPLPPPPPASISNVISRADPTAGPSSRAAALGVRRPRPPPAAPSSDDFDDVSFTAESLAAIDSVAAPGAMPRPASALRQSHLPGVPARRPGHMALPPAANAGRALGRTTSGSMLQTHLSIRKEPIYTKGKVWDRTAFAASGRKKSAPKKTAKGKGKARDDEDEEEYEDEDEDDEPLVPHPKPLVDTSKPYDLQRHQYLASTIDTYIYPTNHPKRDYQYDIIRACFTDNCLVALPTGLGKTFVAGVVMLNFYRWFPTGKIVFLAPTKPLVNQQIEACQLACGIPSASAAVMTGQSVSAKERVRLWEERRVFYCTPQTLDNDLKNGAVNPRDIVLAVFDEAHKASGSYAYTTILAYITAVSPYFRVLALTATPGSDVPKVQGVVDALHISRIEIREAEAPEIRKYMNEKHTEKHVIPMSDIIEELRERWAALMRPYIQKLVDKNILNDRDLDAKRLRPFRITAKRMEVARDRSSGLMWAIGPMNNLEKMARAMGHLLEFSLGMFHTSLLELAGNSTKDGKKGNSRVSANSIRNNIEFQRMIGDVEGELQSIREGRDGKTQADRHPKMQKTLELLLAHFAQAEDDERDHDVKNDTRAMVFCSFRDCVLELVDMLNEHPALLRATKFVGQSQGKQEKDKGFNQKEQKRTINEFKEGKYNILVSTSIGEEGLDIGEVDFVIIYDMPKQPIKLLQRIGRTGRKRDGHVHALMSEGREDLNWETAQQTHRDIQEEILHSRNLELFEDVERLIPAGPLPRCIEQEMEIDPWDPADQKQKKKLAAAERAPPKGKKKQRGNEIPDDAPSGFKSVAELLKGAKRRAKRKRGEDFEEEEVRGREPSDGEEEEDSELLAAKGGKTKKTARARSTTKKAAPAKKPKTASKATTSKAARSSAGTASIPLELSEDSADDFDNFEDYMVHSIKQAESSSERVERSTQLDFFNPVGLVRKRTPSWDGSSPAKSVPSSPPCAIDVDMDVEVSPVKSEVKSSPLPPMPPPPGKLSPRTAAAAGFSQLAWDDDDLLDSPAVQHPTPSKPAVSVGPVVSPLSVRRTGLGPSKSSDVMPPPPVPPTPGWARRRAAVLDASTPSSRTTASVIPGSVNTAGTGTTSGAHVPADSPAGTESSPMPVRRRRAVALPSSSDLDSPAPMRRLRRRRESGDENREANREARRKRRVEKELLDLDAEVSGNDSGDESSDTEDESDRLFAGNFQPTQAPRGYNQGAMYAAGLSTQACARNGLAFGSEREERRAAFLQKARKAVLVSDEERSDNEYELGSFVCDDEDLAFLSASDPLGSGL